MAQAKSYGAQLGAADSLLEPKLEPVCVDFSHPLMHSSPSLGTSSLQDLRSDLHERFP